MTDVVIIGAGGAGREACWVFREDDGQARKWNVLGFIDDDPELQEASICDLPVLGGFSWLERNSAKNFRAICPIGNPRSRKLLVERARALQLSFCSVVHPSVCMSRWVEIGPGSVICAGAIVTTHVKIGAHVTVNVNCSISHDTVIGAYCNLNPGCRIAGAVNVGEGVELGMASAVIQKRRIGDWSVIGAGAVVTRDVPNHVTAVGVPCRVIKEHDAQLATVCR